MIVISWRIKRLKVSWRRLTRRFGATMYPEKQYKISPYQEKAIRLWKMLLKDKECRLGVNSYGVRQIEKGDLLMVFQSANGTNDDSVLTIMDVTDSGNNLYELHISYKSACNVCESFDTEMDRRMNDAENIRRSIIETDLDKLLRRQEDRFRSQRTI
jgi:hypothetical protein